MPVESIKQDTIEYFYKIAKDNGFNSLVFDPICKNKEDVDVFIEELQDVLEKIENRNKQL